MELSFAGENRALPELTRLARMKTAALFTYCCETGAIMGKASAAARQALAAYGQGLGIAYQISDELLRLEQTDTDAGEERKDASRKRATVVSVLGPERARAQAEALIEQARAHLDLFDEKADLLRAAAQFAVIRKS